MLAKLLCHNICCLIHTAFELGIESTFWGNDQLRDEPESAGAADEMLAAWPERELTNPPWIPSPIYFTRRLVAVLRIEVDLAIEAGGD